MSKPGDRLAECVGLIRSFVAMSPESVETYTPKGGAMSRLRGPVEEKPGPHEERTGSRDAGGEEYEPAPSSELLQLINDYELPPPESRCDLAAIIPSSLPPEIRMNVVQLERKDFVEIFNVEAAVEKVENGAVSSAELICIYLKSFRNIFIHDLDELRDERLLYERILGYFSYVLQDVMESLFPQLSQLEQSQSLSMVRENCLL